MFLATIATVATEFILPESYATYSSDGPNYLLTAFIPGFVTLVCLIATIASLAAKDVGSSIVSLLGLVVFSIPMVIGIVGIANSGDYQADAQATVQEIEDEYDIEFKTKDFANKVTALTGEKPTEGNTYTLENLIYNHDDNLYSTDLTIVYSIDDRDRSVIELYHTSDAENLTPFDPAHGEPASSNLTLTEKE